MPDAFVPALAEFGLDRIPGYRVTADGDEDEHWRAEWFAWRDRIREFRLDLQERCEADRVYRAHVKELCKADPALLRGHVPGGRGTPPRRRGRQRSTSSATTCSRSSSPSPIRRELLYLFATRSQSPRKLDVYISKARGIGVSYTMMAAAYWAWLFTSYRGRFLSEKLEKVDRSLDLDCLFGKVDLFLEATPLWLSPKGFSAPSTASTVSRGCSRTPRPERNSPAKPPPATPSGAVVPPTSCNDEAAFQENYTQTKATISGST